MTTPTPGPVAAIVYVAGCPRCDADHTDLAAYRLSRPRNYTHWATCPGTGEPVLLVLADGPAPPSPSPPSRPTMSVSRSADVAAAFADAAAVACPLKVGATPVVTAVSLREGDGGADLGVRLAVELRLPDGTVVTLVGADVVYEEDDDLTDPDRIARMAEYFGLTPAGARRRLRRAGLLPAAEGPTHDDG